MRFLLFHVAGGSAPAADGGIARVGSHAFSVFPCKQALAAAQLLRVEGGPRGQFLNQSVVALCMRRAGRACPRLHKMQLPRKALQTFSHTQDSLFWTPMDVEHK